MKDVWNEISYYLSECKNGKVLEKDYEATIVQCLSILGWKKYLGEITTQYPVQVGHETKLADIVVSSDNIERFVIEVKRPGHIICPEDERQIFSYMRLLKHQVSFGLYVGDDIRLYYDDRASSSLPEPIFVIDIIKDNADGIKFVELFSKDSFSIERLTEFCLQKKEELAKDQKIQEEISRLSCDKEGMFFKQLYKESCIAKGLGEDFAERVLEGISFAVHHKASPVVMIHDYAGFDSLTHTRENSKSHPKSSNTAGTKKHRRYQFNGILCKNAGVLAYCFVKKFTEDNPQLNYFELCRELPQCIRVFKYEEFIAKKTFSKDPDYDRRWLCEPDAVVCSSDNIRFVVQTGWNYWGYGDNRPSNICSLIEFARKKGYDVKEL